MYQRGTRHKREIEISKTMFTTLNILEDKDLFSTKEFTPVLDFKKSYIQ